MNSGQPSRSLSDFRSWRLPAASPGLMDRWRATLAEAARAYSESLVCRALTIEPAARRRPTLDVHFCEVR